MRFDILKVIAVILNYIVVTSTASVIDFGFGEQLSKISPDLKNAHTRVARNWLSVDNSAALERRQRIMKTAGEFVNDLKTLLSGKMPFVKAVPASRQQQNVVSPSLTESQIKKLLKSSNTAEKTGYLDKAMKKALTKNLNAGSLAAGAVGMLWPGPLAPVVSALLAPIVSDYLASKNQNQ